MTVVEPTRPWSQGVVLTWKPNLAFFEHKHAVLRYLDQRGGLRRFRIVENEIDARLDDQLAIGVSAVGLTLTDTSGPLAADSALAVVEEVIQLLEPRVSGGHTWLQHVYGLQWPIGLEEACRQASIAMFGSLADAASIQDFAILADGIDVKRGLTYQGEFGIISGEDGPRRLARLVGNRIGAPETGALDEFLRRDFPDLALFLDSRWKPADDLDPSMTAADLLQILRQATIEGAEDLLLRLYRHISPEHNDPGVVAP